MKTTKDEIINVSLRLFAERGFDAVSTSMIAGELGITKGALYRHFANKQEIFDSIIKRMYELDEQRANEDHVPAEGYEQNPESYQGRDLMDFCEFVNKQFIFWTEDSFASAFRRMITIEQYKNPQMNKLYQDVIAMGPVQYSADLLSAMLREGKLNDKANEYGPMNLAIELFAPLKLAIELADGANDRTLIGENLRQVTRQFEERWMKNGV